MPAAKERHTAKMKTEQTDTGRLLELRVKAYYGKPGQLKRAVVHEAVIFDAAAARKYLETIIGRLPQ